MSRANEPIAPIHRPDTHIQSAGSTGSYVNGFTANGLTIREEFAKAAMQGLCAASGSGCFSNYKELGLKSADELLTKVAVNLADALIAELAKAKS